MLYPLPINNLFFTTRSQEKGETTISLLENFISKLKTVPKNINLKYYILDVVNIDQINQLSLNLTKNKTKIDLFIYNSGIFILKNKFKISNVKKTIDINFTGPRLIFETLLKNNNLTTDAKISVVSSQMGQFYVIKHDPVLTKKLSLYQSSDFTENNVFEAVENYVNQMQDFELAKKNTQEVYSMSKLLVTIYFSTLSRKYPNMHFLALCPGWCITDMTKGMPAPRSSADGGKDIIQGIIPVSYTHLTLPTKA